MASPDSSRPSARPMGRPGRFAGIFSSEPLHVLKMMREDIGQLKLERFLAPCLTDDGRALSAFLGGAVDGVEDRHAGKIRMANRAAIVKEVVEGGIDDGFKIPSKRFHSSDLLLIADCLKSATVGRASVHEFRVVRRLTSA
jgi:hypothetical protein